MPNKVKVVCIFNNKKWTLFFDESLTKEDVLNYMVEKKYIPPELRVRHNKFSPGYPDIYDGAELVFYDPSIVDIRGGAILYGCPTASEINDDVPECMLIGFNGYIIEEL